MACPGAASVIAVWLSGALAQQVASRIPSLPEPRHAIGPAPPPGAEEPSLLEIGRLEGRWVCGVEAARMGLKGRPVMEPDAGIFVCGARGSQGQRMCIDSTAPELQYMFVCACVCACACACLCVCV